MIVSHSETNLRLTECVDRALKVTRFTKHTGLKPTPFALHHARNPRTELTKMIEDGVVLLWLNFLFPNFLFQRGRKAKISFLYGARWGRRHTSVSSWWQKRKPRNTRYRYNRKKTLVSQYLFKFVEKNYEKFLEGKFQQKIQTTVNRSGHTVTTESGQSLHREHISVLIVFKTTRRKNEHWKSPRRIIDIANEMLMENTFSGKRYSGTYWLEC